MNPLFASQARRLSLLGLLVSVAARAGGPVPFDTGRLPTWRDLRVEHPDFDEIVSVDRSRLRCPTGAAVLFHKTAQITFGGLSSFDDGGTSRTHRTVDDFLATDPQRERGAGRMFASEGSPFLLDRGTAGDRMRFYAEFNCHGFALADALGPRRVWLEGQAARPTENTNPVEVLLGSYYELVQTVTLRAAPPEHDAEDRDGRARALRALRRDVLAEAIGKIRDLDADTTALKDGMVVVLTANPVTGRHLPAFAHVHSGKLVRLRGAVWGVQSKLGEATPVVVTSLAPLFRTYAGAFNEIRFYRLRGTGPRSGVVAKDDLRGVGGTFDYDRTATAVGRVLFRPQGRPSWSRSAFFLTTNGYFVTAYDVMKPCFDAAKDRDELARERRCEGEGFRMVLETGGREYPVSIVSHLREAAAATDVVAMLAEKPFVVGKVTLPEGVTVGALTLAAPAPAPGATRAPLIRFRPLPKLFLPGFNEDGGYRLVMTEAAFLEARGLGLLSGTMSALTSVLAPPADRERATATLHEWFPDGTGDGLSVSTSLMGAPALGTDGTVKAFLIHADQGQPLGLFLSRNVLLDTFFTRERPAAPLFSVRAGETEYWLKDR